MPARQGGADPRSDTALDRLQRQGRYTPPATQPTPWPTRAGGPAYTSGEVDALLADLRNES